MACPGIVRPGKPALLNTIEIPEDLRRLVPREDEEPSLEDVFMELTGRSLQEGEE